MTLLYFALFSLASHHHFVLNFLDNLCKLTSSLDVKTIVCGCSLAVTSTGPMGLRVLCFLCPVAPKGSINRQWFWF